MTAMYPPVLNCGPTVCQIQKCEVAKLECYLEVMVLKLVKPRFWAYLGHPFKRPGRQRGAAVRAAVLFLRGIG